MGSRENPSEYAAYARWTPEEAAKWYVSHLVSPDLKAELEAKYSGGSWTALNGQVVFVGPGGEIAEETLPRLAEMYRVGDGSHIGGAGQKSIYADKYGRQYIFKPSISKSGQKEPFRALIQQAVSRIASKIFHIREYVPLYIDVTTEGMTGSVQPLVSGVIGNLKEINWRCLTQEQIRDIQREHVLDWVVCNFNSHPGNFILVERGQVLGVDKEQAFRFIDDPASLQISLDYHPNRQYGKQGPIYNEIYQEYKDGKIKLEFSAAEEPLNKLDGIEEAEYREILRPYAESLKLPESFYDKALARKRNARGEFQRFFASVGRQREETLSRGYSKRGQA